MCMKHAPSPTPVPRETARRAPEGQDAIKTDEICLMGAQENGSASWVMPLPPTPTIPSVLSFPAGPSGPSHS